MGDEVPKDDGGSQKKAAGAKRREPIEVRVPGTQVHLVRDLLDNRLVDWRSEPMGRVDGLVLVAEDGAPPRVACIECGPTVLARRLHKRIGRWVLAAARRWGVRRGRPVRIDWAKVKAVGIDIDVNVDAGETRALALEYWLREHFICRIPGASFKKGTDKKN